MYSMVTIVNTTVLLKFFYIFIYLFIGCIVSLLLCAGFLFQ